jgi:hypothetical protein
MHDTKNFTCHSVGELVIKLPDSEDNAWDGPISYLTNLDFLPVKEDIGMVSMKVNFAFVFD